MARSITVNGTSALSYAPAARANFSVYEGGRSFRGDSLARRRPSRASILITSLVLSVFLAGSIALISGVFASRQAAELRAIEAIEWQTVSVAQGDSLWKIAEARPVDGLGTDALVDAIMQRNGMTKGALMAGDDLQVPVSQS